MAELVITYWRDIPAQVTAGRRRDAVRRELPPRFMEAIDACAMKVGAKDSDAYTAEWRKGAAQEIEGEAEQAAEAAVARLDDEYDRARLVALTKSEGWDR